MEIERDADGKFRPPDLLAATAEGNSRVAEGMFREALAEAERDRADARAWRRFEASGLLTRLWLAVKA